MKINLSKRLFLAAAVLAAAAVLVMGFFVAVEVRSVVAGPDAAAPAAAPTPVGHEWSQVEGHGTGTGLWWLGTTTSQALELRVNSARALRLEPNATSPNLIGGNSGNWVTVGAVGATIGGGGASGNPNRVTDDYGTLAGGRFNQAGDATGTTADRPYTTVGGGYSNYARFSYATIAGGSINTASGSYASIGGGQGNTANADYATIAGGGRSDPANNGTGNRVTDSYGAVGGGGDNQAGNADGDPANAPYATVGGGYENTASGQAATVGGGAGNEASGTASMVPGGNQNTAAGPSSFAAGYRAKANNAGCFVWGDSTDADVACDDDNRFIARASGGVEFYSKADLSTWCKISPGGGNWSCSSDRNVKENFTPVDGQEVLASLAAMPITTWNMKGQDDSIRHMGPVAQDFSAAFSLGDDELSIGSGDIDGVALAAIQGLYQLSQEQAARIQALEQAQGANGSGLSGGPLSSALTPGWLLLGGLFAAGLVVVQRRRAGGRR